MVGCIGWAVRVAWTVGDSSQNVQAAPRELLYTNSFMYTLIGLGVLFIAALVAAYLSSKWWHWGQVVLVFLLFLAAVGYGILAADVLRKHNQTRTKYNEVTADLERLRVENAALLHGTRDADVYGRLAGAGIEAADDELVGIRTLESRLSDKLRARGAVWRNVIRPPQGQINPQTGAVPITQQRPTAPPPADQFAAQPAEPPAPFVPLAGLEEGAIVYAFEQTPPGGEPFGQYIGEFQVVQRNEAQGGAIIQPVLRQSWAWPRGQQIDPRMQRMANSRLPWVLYDTMPTDRHNALAHLSEDQLRALLPPATVDEYLRNGQPAGEEVDARLKAPFNKNNGLPLTDEQVAEMDPADVEWRFQRPLRDYSLIFQTIARQRIDKFAEYDALQTDIQLMIRAQKGAETIQASRRQEIEGLEHDLAGFANETQIIDRYVQALQTRLAEVDDQTSETEAALREAAAELAQAQLDAIRQLDATSVQSP